MIWFAQHEWMNESLYLTRVTQLVIRLISLEALNNTLISYTVGTRSFEQRYFEILARSKAILGPVFFPITLMYFRPRWYEIRSFAKIAGSKGFSSPEGMNPMLVWPSRWKSYSSHLYKSSPTFDLTSFVYMLRGVESCEQWLFVIITLRATDKVRICEIRNNINEKQWI